MAHELWPEVWGGFECTVARMGSTYRNQIEETGHSKRLADLDAVRALGIRTLRYPALWETISPDHPDQCEWRWHDERFGRLQALGIRPIAGLLHHGSGPRYTSLVDPEFPRLFARHAERVAERYPWIDLFTPVNEPLTTARFSALYGHWYPHETAVGPFLRALVNQCKGTVLGMRAIRRITPSAQLVQTEDIAKTFSTPALSDQARFENQRRWLSFDLLFGRVDKSHPWHPILLLHGITEAELDMFLEADAAPDVIGVNHYLTSERFLDRNWRKYPRHLRGGNGFLAYADAEAVRIDLPPLELGPRARLREVLERYGRPVAVTEVHHGCSRDEQLRWLAEVWTAAAELRAENHDVRAVTIWSLLGALDWSSLLVARNGIYEPGAFDLRGPAPRRTAIGKAAASLVRTGGFDHPVLSGEGWWRRQERFYQPVASRFPPSTSKAQRPILITGAAGAIGQAFGRICATRGLHHVMTRPPELDISDPASTVAVLTKHRPWAVIDAAGFGHADGAERHAEACRQSDTAGVEPFGSACATLEIPLVTFSSDRVFDGRLGRPYVESDATCPTEPFGHSEARAETILAEVHPGALVIRTSSCFGPWDRDNFAFAMLHGSATGRMHALSRDIVSPTYIPDLVHATLDLLIDDEKGIWHLANQGQVSWGGFASLLSKAAGRRNKRLASERRPAGRNTALASEKTWIMPTLESAIARFVRDCAFDWRADTTLVAAE